MEERDDPDPEKKAQWRKIPCAGEMLTPDEWLKYVVETIEVAEDGDPLRWYPDL